MFKLNLDRDKVESCRGSARKISRQVQDIVDRHTTVSIERACLRLLGVEDAHQTMPIVNLVVGSLSPEQLSRGIFYWLARAMAHHRLSPVEVCRQIAEKKIRWNDLPEVEFEIANRLIEPLVRAAFRRLQESAAHKRRSRDSLRTGPAPLKYLIVATGNIHEDVAQARSAVLHGADCIAVIRSTAQSLIDYVPHGATTEGFGGTYATQENFRIMRKALDEVGRKVGRYIRLVNYSSGLCMPEIAAMAAVENLDYLLNDSMYGILFRDINMKRTFTDQYFSRLIIAHSRITINTGEDNYLTTAESFRAFPQVLASQFINEQLALTAQLNEDQIGLGHAFEMDPMIENSLLYEIAQAEMVREIFPRSPIKYMPPTRHMTGDIFFGHILDTMFNLVSVMTHQEIHLLGMPTEAIHNPLLQDRFMSLKATKYLFNAARDLGDEISWSDNGKVIRRARSVLEDAYQLLSKVEKMGLMQAIEEGLFANMMREENGGRGREGVIEKDKRYWNPLLTLMEKKPEIIEEIDRRSVRAYGDSEREPRRDSQRRSRPRRSKHRGGGRGPRGGRSSGPREGQQNSENTQNEAPVNENHESSPETSKEES